MTAADRTLVLCLGNAIRGDDGVGWRIAEELLAVHRSYLAEVLPLVEAGLVKAAAHITGGGLLDNLPRALPEGLAAELGQLLERVQLLE